MFQRLLFIPATLFVGLMLLQPDAASAQVAQQAQTASAHPTYNFSYKIAGDRMVAPVQVFDNGAKTYLQFRDLTTLPAIFADTPLGEVLLKPGVGFDVEPPYVIVRNIEPELILVMNKRKAYVSYQGPITEFITKTPVMFGARQPIALSPDATAPVSPDAFAKMHQHAQIAAAPTSTQSTPVNALQSRDATDAGALTVKAIALPAASEKERPTTASPPATAFEWTVSASDQNLRKLLKRWTGVDAPGHDWTVIWDVEKDIPIETSDLITADFKTAVRHVLASTQFSDITLQPCFYTNNVVRVVRKTTKCNPSE